MMLYKAALFQALLSIYLSSTHALTPANNSAVKCCDRLQSILPGNVFMPSDPVYQQQQSTYYSGQQRTLRPTCRVSPASAQDVSQIIRTATSMDCSFAVRSGGHMNWPNSSNVNNLGFTIDMERLNQISLSSDKKNVSLGPGSRWVEVYTELSAHNLTTMGGRSAPVGVGGFLLGGGISFFSPTIGLSSSYILEYEIVLADGEIVTASDSVNSDLQWALRLGKLLGSTNYGIITRYTMPTIEQGDMWGGSLVLSLEDAPALLDFLANYTQAVNGDTNGGLSATSITWDPSLKNYSVASFNVNLRPQEFPPLFSGLREFVPHASTNTLRIANLTSIAVETASGDPSGQRDAWWTLSVTANSQLIQDIFSYGQTHFADLLQVNGTTWSLTVQPINRKMINATINSGSPAGFTEEDTKKDLFLILEHLKWDDPSLDSEMESHSQQFLSWAQDFAREKNLLNEFLYLNYADGSQPIYERVGQNNLRRLEAVKANVDPNDIFGNLWIGGFKL